MEVKIGHMRDKLLARALKGRAEVNNVIGDYRGSLRDYKLLRSNFREPRDYLTYMMGIYCIYERTGKFKEALEITRKALSYANRHHFSFIKLKLTIQTINIHIRRGNYKKALQVSNSVIDKFKRSEVKDTEKEKYLIEKSNFLINVGSVYLYTGNYEKALAFYREARGILAGVRNNIGLATVLNNMALVYWKKGKYNEALKCNFKALNLRKKTGHMYGISSSLNNLGLIYDERGDYKSAFVYYKKGYEIFVSLGDLLGETIALINIGSIYSDVEGDLEKAERVYRKCLDIQRRVGDKTGMIESLLMLASIYRRQKKFNAFFGSMKKLRGKFKKEKTPELYLSFLCLRIKFLILKNRMSELDRAITSLVRKVKEEGGGLLKIEVIASLMEILSRLNITDYNYILLPEIKKVEKQIEKLESPLRRSNIVRSLALFYSALGDLRKGNKYFDALKTVTKEYKISAFREDVSFLNKRLKNLAVIRDV